MPRFVARYVPDEGFLFGRQAFESQIGKEIPINVPNGPTVAGTIVSVEVAIDGSYANVTFDTKEPIQLDLRS